MALSVPGSFRVKDRVSSVKAGLKPILTGISSLLRGLAGRALSDDTGAPANRGGVVNDRLQQEV